MTTIALVSGLIYFLIFTLPFPLVRYYATIPPVDYAKLTNYARLGLVAYVVGIGALFWLYIWAIRLTRPSKDNGPRATDDGRLILLTSTFLAAISLFAYPLTAIDLFIYAIRTRGWALYDLNPLATAPEMLPATDPWLSLAAEWVDAPSPYGPIWELTSLGTFYLSGGDFLAQLFGLKIVMVLIYLGCVWLVYQILRIIQPAWTVTGAIAFAWNPLVLLESVQNAHNDIVMIFFWLAAVWLLVGWVQSQTKCRLKSALRLFPNRGLTSALRLLLVCILLALSILVKFVTIITVPFFLLAIAGQWKNWPRRLAVMTACGLFIAAVVIAAMWPFWPGAETWAVFEAGSQAGRSLLALLVLGLRGWFGTNTAFDLSRNLILLIFALIYLYYLWKSLKAVNNYQLSVTSMSQNPTPPISTRNVQSLISPAPPLPRSPAPLLPISPSFHTFFWYVLLAAPVFHAWYLLWFAPLAALLLPERRPLIATIVFSITALLVIPYFETIRVWYPYLLQNHFIGHLIGVPLLIVPPALAILWPISSSQYSEVS